MASSAMEGVLKKRNGRMQQWTSRYFVLEGTRISYKLKQDSPSLRGSFDLVCGCQVTPIVEEGLKKKLYTFWIVWPRDKNSKELEEAEDSGDEAEKDGVAAAEAINSGKPEPASKSKVVQSLQKQLDTQKRQRTLVEQQIDRHQAHDNSVQLGVKVAAVAVGGVVIGALTAGIGLIPYITVVGITAVASGSAVAYQWKRPADSRLLLACDSLADASEWKMAVERQIARLEDVQKPMLPASVDPEIIASLLNKHNSNRFGVWKRVAIYEGVRVLEHVYPCAGRDPLGRPLEEAGDKGGVPVFNSMYKSQGTFRCRKAHMSFPCSSINTFLTLMSTKLWPIQGSIQVIKEIDDHADYVGIELSYDCTPCGYTSSGNRISDGNCAIRWGTSGEGLWSNKVVRRMAFSRFWKLDDDGTYLITFNSTTCEEFPASVTGSYNKSKPEPRVDAVITIAPKRDSEEFEYEVPDCMVSCICQVSSDGDWQPGEITTFMDDFLKGHILELRETLLAARTSKAETCIFDKAVTLEKVSRQESSVESKLSLSKQKSEGTSGSASRSHLTAGSGYSDPEDRPTTLKQRLLDRKQRRGITTVQPGLEDLGGDPNQNLRHPVGQTVALHKTLENYDRNVSAGGANANVLRKSIEIDDSNDKKNDDSGKKRRFFSRRDKTPKKLTSVSNNNSPTARLRKAITGTDKERNSEGEGNKERFREVLQNLEDSSDDDKINSNHSDRKAFEIESGKAARSFSPIQFDSTTGDEQSGFRSSTGSIQGNRKEPAVSKKKRDKKVNSQASKLRNQIAAKDYELIRLAKTLRKKQNKIHAPTDTEEVGELKHGRSPDSKIESQQAAVAECAMLQKQQVEIQAELQVMRDSYFALTGDVFEPRKPVFSRLRGLAKEKADKREEQESVTAGARENAVKPEGLTIENALPIPMSGRPAHWAPRSQRTISTWMLSWRDKMRYVALLFYLQLLPFDISESGQIILLEDSSFSGKQLSRSGSTGKGYCRLVSDASLQKMQNVWILFVVAASIVASAFIHEIAVSLSSM